MSRLELVLPLGVADIDREHGKLSSAAGGGGTLPLVGQEVAAVGEQECAKPAPRRVGRGHRAVFEQVGKILLRQVEGLLETVPFAADVRVDRKPVRRAELGQGLTGTRLDHVAGRDHAAPSGRLKASR